MINIIVLRQTSTIQYYHINSAIEDRTPYDLAAFISTSHFIPSDQFCNQVYTSTGIKIAPINVIGEYNIS